MYEGLRNKLQASRATRTAGWRPVKWGCEPSPGNGRLRGSLESLLESRFVDDDGHEETGAMVVALALFEQAANGSTKAFEVIRDTVGERPTAITTSVIAPETYAEVERLLGLGDENERS